MQAWRAEAEGFLSLLNERVAVIDLSVDSFPVDHLCYRASTLAEFTEASNVFAQEAALVVSTFFHGRTFQVIVLQEPIVFQQAQVNIIELAEPGGSDNYERGWQHIEWLIPRTITTVVKQAGDLLYTSSSNGEQYLKWPDKIAVKATPTPLLIKGLREQPKIDINPAHAK